MSEMMGNLEGKRIAIVLDDMINTGGTVEATIKKLVEEKGIREIHLGVSHNLCTERALERLSSLHEEYHLREVTVTDSVPQTEGFRSLPFLTVRSLVDPLCLVINRIHYNRSVDGIFAKPLVAGED